MNAPAGRQALHRALLPSPTCLFRKRMILRAVGRALPPHPVDQESVIAALRDLWAEKHFNTARLEELHRATRVEGRHLALPLAEYPKLGSFAAHNALWSKLAVEVGEAALRDAL